MKSYWSIYHVVNFDYDNLKIKKEIGEKSGLGYSFLNMGNIGIGKGEYDKALEYHERYISEFGIKFRSGSDFWELGIISSNKGNYDKALDVQERSLKIFEEIGDSKFALLVDESRDASMKEQMAMCLRSVHLLVCVLL